MWASPYYSISANYCHFCDIPTFFGLLRQDFLFGYVYTHGAGYMLERCGEFPIDCLCVLNLKAVSAYEQERILQPVVVWCSVCGLLFYNTLCDVGFVIIISTAIYTFDLIASIPQLALECFQGLFFTMKMPSKTRCHCIVQSLAVLTDTCEAILASAFWLLV